MKLFIVKRLTMARRCYRELSDETKKKISDGMKDFHSHRTIDSKRSSARKQSASMQRYWLSIPNKSPSNEKS
jgi:hypothetical protein